MKKMTKALVTLSSGVMAASLLSVPAFAEGEEYHVGVCQLVQHVALDAATKGFEDALTEEVEKAGASVVFDEQNAAGDSATCSTICNTFVSDGVDLIMANATPALQAAQASTADIPILGTSVTDYATALDIDDWTGKTGTNISGTSDLAPLDQQAALFEEVLPDVKKIGILYCSAEANSAYQASVISEALEAMDNGYELTEYTFADSNDVAQVTQQACGEVEALYIPTDNTAAANTELIKNVVVPAGIPVIVGEEGICEGCGIVTLSISYEDLGRATGKMAAKVLLDGEDVSEMDVQFAEATTKKYNADICEELGIEVPDDYVAIGADAAETEAETETE